MFTVYSLTSHNYRILYCIKEYDPVLDSSNIDMTDWATIANDISQYYKQFDGFVVLHGTDTMCYTASALSYMLECLGKSVVLTGSQVSHEYIIICYPNHKLADEYSYPSDMPAIYSVCKCVLLLIVQVPLVELRNDARDNMLGALLVAGQYVIPEVCVYMYVVYCV